MAVTYVHEMVHSGAETLTNQLSGTAVERAGKTGRVRAAFASSDGTNTATLKGRKSGRAIIPQGSHALQETLADWGNGLAFIYEGQVDPDEELDLEVVAAAASTSAVAVIIL